MLVTYKETSCGWEATDSRGVKWSVTGDGAGHWTLTITDAESGVIWTGTKNGSLGTKKGDTPEGVFTRTAGRDTTITREVSTSCSSCPSDTSACCDTYSVVVAGSGTSNDGTWTVKRFADQPFWSSSFTGGTRPGGANGHIYVYCDGEEWVLEIRGSTACITRFVAPLIECMPVSGWVRADIESTSGDCGVGTHITVTEPCGYFGNTSSNSSSGSSSSSSTKAVHSSSSNLSSSTAVEFSSSTDASQCGEYDAHFPGVANDTVVEGPVGSLDLSAPSVTGVLFKSPDTQSYSGLMVMTHASDVVTKSGSGVNGDPYLFTIPSTALIMQVTGNFWWETYKTLTDGTHTHNYAPGTFYSTNSLGSDGFTLFGASGGISKTTLTSKGFMTGGVCNFKFWYVGTSVVNSGDVVGMTCNSPLDQSSQSSQQVFSSSSTSEVQQSSSSGRACDCPIQLQFSGGHFDGSTVMLPKVGDTQWEVTSANVNYKIFAWGFNAPDNGDYDWRIDVTDIDGNCVESYVSTSNNNFPMSPCPRMAAWRIYSSTCAEGIGSFLFNVTLSEVPCDGISNSFSSEAIDCGSFSWDVPVRSEAFGPGRDHLEFSPLGNINFSNPLASGLAFNPATWLDDILVMIPASATITESWTGNQADTATFTVPASAIFFYDTLGWYIGGGSSPKTITDGTHTYNMPASGPLVDGTGHAADIAAQGFTVLHFTDGVSRSLLQSLGYINGSNQCHFRFAHIQSGSGGAHIPLLTCGEAGVTDCSECCLTGTTADYTVQADINGSHIGQGRQRQGSTCQYLNPFFPDFGQINFDSVAHKWYITMSVGGSGQARWEASPDGPCVPLDVSQWTLVSSTYTTAVLTGIIDACESGTSVAQTSSASSLTDNALCRTTCTDCCNTYEFTVSGGTPFDGTYTFNWVEGTCRWVSSVNPEYVMNIVGTVWQLIFSNTSTALVWEADNCTICAPREADEWRLVPTNVTGTATLSINPAVCDVDRSSFSSLLENSSSSSSRDALPCTLNTTAAGGDPGLDQTFDISSYFVGDPTGVRTFYVKFESYTIPDQLEITNQAAALLYQSECKGTQGWEQGFFDCSLSDSPIRVQVFPNCTGVTSGTAWKLELTCRSPAPCDIGACLGSRYPFSPIPVNNPAETSSSQSRSSQSSAIESSSSRPPVCNGVVLRPGTGPVSDKRRRCHRLFVYNDAYHDGTKYVLTDAPKVVVRTDGRDRYNAYSGPFNRDAKGGGPLLSHEPYWYNQCGIGGWAVISSWFDPDATDLTRIYDCLSQQGSMPAAFARHRLILYLRFDKDGLGNDNTSRVTLLAAHAECQAGQNSSVSSPSSSNSSLSTKSSNSSSSSSGCPANCSNCAATLTVVISGMGNSGSCTSGDCSNSNGTFSLPRTSNCNYFTSSGPNDGNLSLSLSGHTWVLQFGDMCGHTDGVTFHATDINCCPPSTGWVFQGYTPISNLCSGTPTVTIS